MAEEADHRYRAIIPPHSGELNCSICWVLFYDPKECPCGHVFCKKCIEQWLTDHSSCPQCEQEASSTSLVTTSAAIIDQILNLEVKCINGDLGGKEMGSLEDLKFHRDICPYQMIQCQNGTCEDRVLLKDKATHDAECQFFFTSCTVCKVGMIRARLPNHSCESKTEQLLKFKTSALIKIYEEEMQNQEMSPELHSQLLQSREKTLHLLQQAKEELRLETEFEAKLKKLMYELYEQ